jgi:hypothetical protein
MNIKLPADVTFHDDSLLLIPGVGYKKILPQPNIELTGIWNMYFYTDNPADHYQSGTQSDLEGFAIKRFKNGFGNGCVDFDVRNAVQGDGFNFTTSLKF